MMLKRHYYLLVVLFLILSCKNQKEIIIKSPNGENILTVFPQSKETDKGQITYSVQYLDKQVILPSVVVLQSKDIDFSNPFSIAKVEESSVENQWKTHLGERSIIPDNYNEVKVYLESSTAKLNLICRAYNEGVVFSYEVPKQSGLETLQIEDEVVTYNFQDDYSVWATPERKPGVTTSKSIYTKTPMSELKPGCERPLLVDCGAYKVALAEARLVDYSRMSFEQNPELKFSIQSKLEARLENISQDIIKGNIVGKLSDKSKVEMKLPFQSPWRVVMVAENEGVLLENNYLISNLNPPSKIEDQSWITPGKAIRETTLTTQGAMATIDFLASHNMQYVHFDAGWYGDEMKNSSDATTITLDPKRSKGPFDLETVCKYAKEKGIKVMLYVNRRALEKQLDELLPLFKKWGVSGIKFGFVRIGTQDATAWLHETIEKCAKYQMVVDVHDHYRPTGFSRTYPNLLTQEGIMGDEHSTTNQQTLTTLFTRMLAGAGDNTVCYYNSRVKKMGSHASQMAKTVCLFSPLQFLYWYDRVPSAPVKDDGLWGDTKTIGNEPELEFFDAVPTTWDETKVLKADIGEIAVLARKKDENWFVGGINGEKHRLLPLDFFFLDADKKYNLKIYTDDPEIKTRTQVRIDELEVDNQSIYEVTLKSNNGFVMILTPK
ncbi:glycoside hydrolase family 97 N-terminal domain-containing protein [Mariniflexile gromovii]|uniref:Glycoside hydrolase family 97 N-terminal domain-containing protein n=1 Tax=Mariniflexile gromovii TaxID=362523 RepID=A0ABS4BTC0_9FLAO|nr:glycoside hydrolase family 97 protein [Mariniflexile gromovii]MBP0903834.1 glycoside hydrolase family 97 N-terminal domain-containing protein [Mariniflexile gromovii]